MRRAILWFVALAIASVLAQQSRPASDPQVVEAARKEGRLIIYSSTDQSSAQALLDDFRKLYPFIQIEYNDLGTQAIYDRFVSETAAGASSADLLWSSAMELQVKLASEGYALPYDSPEAKNWPANARLGNLAYSTTRFPRSSFTTSASSSPRRCPPPGKGSPGSSRSPGCAGGWPPGTPSGAPWASPSSRRTTTASPPSRSWPGPSAKPRPPSTPPPGPLLKRSSPGSTTWPTASSAPTPSSGSAR